MKRGALAKGELKPLRGLKLWAARLASKSSEAAVVMAGGGGVPSRRPSPPAF